MRARIARFTAVIQALLLVGSLALPGLVSADQVVNDIDVTTTGTNNFGTDAVEYHGTLTVNYRINTGGGGDPQAGCNASDATPATLTPSVPLNVHVSPSSRQYTACNVDQSFSLTFDATGSFSITVGVTDSGTGTYNTTPATFTAYAFDLGSYAGLVAQDTFALNASVTARAVGLPNMTGSIEWWRPSGKLNPDFAFSSVVGGSVADTRTANECGTWTLKLYDKSTPNAVLLDTDTFAVNCVVDDDGDGIPNASDNCPNVSNASQANNDGDAQGDACDPDDDNDGVADTTDNCQFAANPGQANNDGDSLGDVCDPDDDNDGVADGSDNCPLVSNAGQADADGDGAGDACDADIDGDGVPNGTDNCPSVPNASQANNDGDTLGDACDPDDDNDGVADGDDNCPFVANAGQGDVDGDGIGTACDSNDAAPAVRTAAADASGDEGDTLTTNGSFTDADGASTLTITKKSGAGTVTPGANGAWSWSLATTDNGSGTTCVQANDGAHSVAVDCFDWFAANVAPTIDISGDASVNEGSSYSLTLGAVSDPGDDDIVTDGIHVDWGDGSSDDYSVGDSASHTYADGPNSYDIKVDLTDEDGTFNDAANALSVQVNNLPPAVSITGAPSGTSPEGTAISLGSSVVDPSSVDQLAGFTYAWSVTKNGSAYGTGTAAGFTFTPNDNGTYVVSLSATDKDSGTGSATPVTITVTNVNPVVAQPSVTSTTVCQGSTASLTGVSFTDPGTVDNPWTYLVTWGDGTTSSGSYTSQGAQSDIGPATFSTPGTYTPTLKITDKDGGFTTATSSNSFTVVAHYVMKFLQPVDGTTDGSISNAVKLGRVVPIKVVIWDNCANGFAGGYVNDPATLVRLRAALAPAAGGTLLDTVEMYADAGAANNDTLYFRWTADSSVAGGGFWIYNLDTKNSSQPKFELNKIYRIDASIGGQLGSGTGTQYALLKMAK